MDTFVLWNPINLLDVEAKWLITEALVLFFALIFSKLLGVLLRVLDKRINSPSFHIFAISIYSPLIFLLWFFVILFSLDLVTDDLLKEFYPRIFSALVNGVSVLTVGWFLLRLKNGLIINISETNREKESSLDTATLLAISKLLTIGIGIFILVLLHDAAGMSLTTFLAFGGVGGLALAFASQEIFSNFFGGLMVHITRPFTLSENIVLPAHNIDGHVEEIGWYQTRVRALSKAAVYIPNSLFTKALLINKSRITYRVIDDTLSFSIYPLSSISVILAEATKYLRKQELINSAEWTGARIRSLEGPICIISLQATLKADSIDSYYRKRDEILLEVGKIISSHGGVLSTPHVTF